MTILAPHPVEDWDDREPTAAELRAIEAEWPRIAAEVADLDSAFERYSVTLDVADLEYRPEAPATGRTLVFTARRDLAQAERDSAILATANAFHAECGVYYWTAAA
ncbi:DUF6284 family protein [Phytomonospora sp. NPDC050363]|uniref:DUF6284 family protein n=1 Tax=Phytomonospora sp. NPDC050363 TaxID=3155642 RepID=UPI00340142C8